MIQKSSLLFLSLVLTIVLSACGKNSGSSLSLTRIKPPVQETAGSTLTAGTSSFSGKARVQSVTEQTVKARFFSTGPTDIMRILGQVDDELAAIESQAGDSDSNCLTQEPVDKTLTLFGEAVTFNFQCYLPVTPSGIILFGKKDDTWSVYSMVGAGPIAAKATDLGNGKTAVEIWGGVGFGNTPTWDAMSYTGFHLKANNQTGAFEMTAGGMGVGFCGVTLKADGTNMYAYGSEDGPGCSSISSSCVLMSDLTTAGNCSSINENHFELTALGRASTTGSNTGNIPATWAASTYPAGGATLILDGSGTDMLNFGMASVSDVPAGVAKF